MVCVCACMCLFCRYTDSPEGHLPHAGYPWTACTCYHALHSHHGATVSYTQTYFLRL